MELLTNNFDLVPDKIVNIYGARWGIESLFKHLKRNFQRHFFYGESACATKILICVTLIANLLFAILQRGLTKSWSFSNLATIVKIVLMEYMEYYSFFNHLEKRLAKNAGLMQELMAESSPESSLFDRRGLVFHFFAPHPRKIGVCG